MKNTKENKMPGSRGKLYAVSNAHLDTQWNWTVVDTIRDCCKATLENNLSLFEKFPGYVFNFEGAFHYALMKEYYPELYKKMQKAVKDGRWNPCGAMWDAADMNVPSSEALMRQILYGNRFFESELGKKTEDIFLPDCFGFRAALPTIARHMGLIAFSTQKLEWGVGSPRVKGKNKKTFPPMLKSRLPQVDLGIWRGLDGSEIYASFLSGNYTYEFNKRGDTRPVNERAEFEKKLCHNEKVSGTKKRNLYFGTGDYGGSCSEGCAEMLQAALDDKGGMYDVVSATSTQIYHELTEEEKKALPVYEGGLLIPHGYGAMTSHAELKRMNRRNEKLGGDTERASVLSWLISGYPYPAKNIEKAYKTFLWHQFHDDVTGTSIAEAYKYSHNDQVLASKLFAEELTCALSAAAKRLNTSLKGQPIVVFNPTSFARKEIVRVASEGKYASVCDPTGKPVSSCLDGETLAFVSQMKPLSLKVYYLREDKGNCASASKTNVLENGCLRVTIDNNGDVSSICDKKLGKEILKAPIRYEIFNDNSTVWPSWEFNFNDLQSAPKGEWKLVSAEYVDASPVYKAVKVVKTLGKSRFEILITLPEGSDELRFDCVTDWFEMNSLLTARFPFTAENENALFDSGACAVKGGKTDNYPYFVHNVHEWAELTDRSGEFGVTVANNCKYAMGKPDDGTLQLMLIHTPKGNFMSRSGQNYQDFGKNYYSFTVKPHGGKNYDEGIKAAEALNDPLSVFFSEKHSGRVKEITLMSEISGGIAVRAIKKAEDGDRIIVRLQEIGGRNHKGVKVTLKNVRISKVVECDGYETEIGELADGKVDLTKYQVKTLALYPENAPEVSREADKLTLPLTVDTVGGELPFNIPSEFASEEIVCGDILFGTSEKAMPCDMQTIELGKKYKTLKLLMASLKPVKAHKFGNRYIKVSEFNKPVGTYESVVAGDITYINRDTVAKHFTHINKNGEPSLYDFGYIFEYDIDVTRREKITLPKDKNILVFSAVGVKDSEMTPAVDLYERADASTELNTLTVTGMDAGGNYAENALVMLDAPVMNDCGIFDRFEGEGIVMTDENNALIKMPDHPITVKAVYKKLGKDIAEGKSCSANGCVHKGEAPEKAFDGDPYTKWCASPDENGVCWLSVDLGKEHLIKGYAICHAGALEGRHWNTKDFDILVKEKEEDEWTVADSVKGNAENVTSRELSPVKARFVRLSITAPTNGDDNHARIYLFRIFE